MYSPFYGKDFLFSYLKNRLNFINNFENKKPIYENDYYYLLVNFIKKNKKNWQIDSDLKSLIDNDSDNIQFLKKKYASHKYKSLFDLKRSKIIKTSDLLDTIIINAINRKYEIETRNYVELFIRKFEVSKKIYIYYSNNFKKIDNQANHINIYLKLSTLISIECLKKPNNRYLSTLLKINDLIISCKSEKKIKLNEYKLILILEKLFVKKLIKKNIY